MQEAAVIRWAVCSATWQPGEESFEEYLSLLPHSVRSEVVFEVCATTVIIPRTMGTSVDHGEMYDA